MPCSSSDVKRDELQGRSESESSILDATRLGLLESFIRAVADAAPAVYTVIYYSYGSEIKK
jgi:hypothetical protein